MPRGHPRDAPQVADLEVHRGKPYAGAHKKENPRGRSAPTKEIRRPLSRF